MKKYTFYLKRLWLTGILLILGGVFATQIWFTDSLETLFPNLGSGDAAVHFATAGNNFWWLFLLRGIENVSSDGVVLSGETITCAKKLKGLYFNSARGNRVRPLDQESLNNLQGLHSWYDTVTVTGWLFMRCTGKNPASIAGQVTVTRKGTSYILLAGVQMNTNNTYTTIWADTFQYAWGILSGKLFDNYGGVGNVLWTGLTVNVGDIPSQWGGTHMLTKDSCKISSTNTTPGTNQEGIDYSPSYYDHSCVWPILPQKTHEIAPVCFEYTDELNQAYNFAYSFDITTITPCEQVRMYDNLIRKDMAKMMVNFVIKVLNRQDIYVDNPSCENYTDIKNETSEMTFYIQTACKLGLMGLEYDGITPQKKFNPYGIVTRAEFGTVISRLLRWLDNSAHDGEPYYQEHLLALKEANIMKQIAKPYMKELRGRVFIMMNRIYNMGLDNQ